MDVLQKKSPTATLQLPPSLIISPTKIKSLPPISPRKIGTEEQLPLEQSKEEVEEAMKHLLSEVRSAEGKVQKSADMLWQRMLDIVHQKSQEMEQKYSLMQNQLEESKTKIIHLTNQEAVLIKQTAAIRVQLSSEEKIRHKLETEITKLKHTLSENEKALSNSSAAAMENEKTLLADKKALQDQLQQKETILKEYQSKTIKLTERINKLSQELSSEKATSKQHQKSNSDLLSQQTSETRKLLLELSKLKSQLSSVNSSLATSKDENRNLEQKLKIQREDQESTLERITNKHDEIVKELKTQISALQSELKKMKSTHARETENLKSQLVEVHAALEAETAASSCTCKRTTGDDYMEARIKFLQHQNRQEKVKLKKGQE